MSLALPRLTWTEIKLMQPAGSEVVVLNESEPLEQVHEVTATDACSLRGTWAWLLLKCEATKLYAEPWGLVPVALLRARSGVIRRSDCVRVVPPATQVARYAQGMPDVCRTVNLDEVRAWADKRMRLYRHLESSQAPLPPELTLPAMNSVEDKVGYLSLLRVCLLHDLKHPTRGDSIWMRGEAAILLHRLVWGHVDLAHMVEQLAGNTHIDPDAALESLFNETGESNWQDNYMPLPRLLQEDTRVRLRGLMFRPGVVHVWRDACASLSQGTVAAFPEAWMQDLVAFAAKGTHANLAHMRACVLLTGHAQLDQIYLELAKRVGQIKWVELNAACAELVIPPTNCDVDDLVRMMPGCMANMHTRATEPGGAHHLKYSERTIYAAYLAGENADIDTMLAVQTHPERGVMSQALNGADWVRKQVQAGTYGGGTSCRTLMKQGACPLAMNGGGPSAAWTTCCAMEAKTLGLAEPLKKHAYFPSLMTHRMRTHIDAVAVAT